MQFLFTLGFFLSFFPFFLFFFEFEFSEHFLFLFVLCMMKVMMTNQTKLKLTVLLKFVNSLSDLNQCLP